MIEKRLSLKTSFIGFDYEDDKKKLLLTFLLDGEETEKFIKARAKLGHNFRLVMTEIREQNKTKWIDNHCYSKLLKRHDIIKKYLIGIPVRSSHIIRHRLGIDNCEILTIASLAKMWKISTARISGIFVKELKKIKKKIGKDGWLREGLQ